MENYCIKRRAYIHRLTRWAAENQTWTAVTTVNFNATNKDHYQLCLLLFFYGCLLLNIVNVSCFSVVYYCSVYLYFSKMHYLIQEVVAILEAYEAFWILSRSTSNIHWKSYSKRCILHLFFYNLLIRVFVECNSVINIGFMTEGSLCCFFVHNRPCCTPCYVVNQLVYAAILAFGNLP